MHADRTSAPLFYLQWGSSQANLSLPVCEKNAISSAMKKLIALLLLGIAGAAMGLTPKEFEQLYNTPEKDGTTCYKLYQAYAQGDGVDKDAARARK